MGAGPVPLLDITWTWGNPALVLMKAMRMPSGDHTGLDSEK
jgi:hypothetical protein